MEIAKEQKRALRVQSSSSTFRRLVFQTHGTYCVNCGSSEEVDLHHIVPIAKGGTNNIQNIVPLCRKCHMAVHDKTRSHHRNCTGRPKTVDKIDGWQQIVWDYLNCRIGKREAAEMLGMGNASKLSDAVWFKRYLRDNNITEYRNNLDMARCSHSTGLYPGRIVGYFVKDGKRIDCTWEG